ncbi:DMT family transporter [Rhizobium sp. LjRoot30]|uniref:DMT family transporter n=1 Tax=Rhizobium sp. LjRoot30 TaxID=3342320 RepID=UPI003ECFDDD8
MNSRATDPLKGILLKIASVMVFVGMQTFIKMAGPGINPGQITFHRSAFAIVPIVLFLAYRGQLRDALYTRNPVGHLKRGSIGILAMGCGFYGLVHLPMPEAIAIGYAMPLFAVAFAAIFLGETVRVYRWTAVLFGLAGVMIISWPNLTLFLDGGFSSEATTGALAVLFSAGLGAAAMIQVRQLVREEKTTTIVLYFSLIASLFSLATLPFGWDWLDFRATMYLVLCGFCGGVAQILLTSSYRYAEVSIIAPFEYTSILLGIAISYILFDDVPTTTMLFGTAIVVSAGIFIIYRERRLGLSHKSSDTASK